MGCSCGSSVGVWTHQSFTQTFVGPHLQESSRNACPGLWDSHHRAPWLRVASMLHSCCCQFLDSVLRGSVLSGVVSYPRDLLMLNVNWVPHLALQLQHPVLTLLVEALLTQRIKLRPYWHMFPSQCPSPYRFPDHL